MSREVVVRGAGGGLGWHGRGADTRRLIDPDHYE